MKNSLIVLGIFINFGFFACEKEEDITCTTFPCDGTDDRLVNYNRVAYDPAFRIGTWVNVRASASSPDTIIFHNNYHWSNFNELGGYYNGKYAFNGLYLQILTDIDNNLLADPIDYQTYYNDSTSVFSILRQQGTNGFQRWDHYIKIE